MPSKSSVVVKTFITGMGRSGTMFLARLLSEASGVACYHESPGDRDALVHAYWMDGKLASHRDQLVNRRLDETQCEHYIEVNSYLRYSARFIQQVWHAPVFHLVRDGRDFVRSTMNRKAYTEQDKDHSGRIQPRIGNPWMPLWKSMDRFQRVCWYWNFTVSELMAFPAIRFEDIIESYTEFSAQVLQPLKINITEERWYHHASRPVNTTKRKKFPHWKDWSDAQLDQFEQICGKSMAHYYPNSWSS